MRLFLNKSNLYSGILVLCLLHVSCYLPLTDINECLASPCVNGNCSNTLGSYTCICDPGWTGTNCSQGKLSKQSQSKMKLENGGKLHEKT